MMKKIPKIPRNKMGFLEYNNLRESIIDIEKVFGDEFSDFVLNLSA